MQSAKTEEKTPLSVLTELEEWLRTDAKKWSDVVKSIPDMAQRRYAEGCMMTLGTVQDKLSTLAQFRRDVCPVCGKAGSDASDGFKRCDTDGCPVITFHPNMPVTVKPRIHCVCGWKGTKDQLVLSSGLGSQKIFHVCPQCGYENHSIQEAHT